MLGKGILGSVGVVMSINEQEGIATVKFPSCDYRKTCKASDVLTVPISRLCTPRSEVSPLKMSSIVLKLFKIFYFHTYENVMCPVVMEGWMEGWMDRSICTRPPLFSVFISCPYLQALPLYKLSITEKVVQAVQSMLLPQEGSLSIHTSLPASGDGSSPVMAAVRLLAEIRTRSVPLWVLANVYHQF